MGPYLIPISGRRWLTIWLLLNSKIKLTGLQPEKIIFATKQISIPLRCTGPGILSKNGYKLHLIYLCLDSIEEAKRRVAIRVQNGGHFVPEW